MKKVGDLSTRFNLHPDTIRDWTDSFEEFFSPGARKGGGVRREFSYDDEVVINTIHELRKQRVDFEEIRARLTSGERITTLPPTNEPVPPESALTVYAELRELKVQITSLQAQLTEEKQLRTAERETAQERISALREQLAVLKYRLGQLDDEDDK